MHQVGIVAIALLLCCFAAYKWIKYVESIYEAKDIKLTGEKLKAARFRNVSRRE